MHQKIRAVVVEGACVATVIALALAPGSAQAVANDAVCSAHVPLAMHADRFNGLTSSLACTGNLDGELVTNGGRLELWGRYTAQSRGSSCGVSLADTVFSAQAAREITILNQQPLLAEGGMTMDGPPALDVVTGGGDSEGAPFTLGGTGSFTHGTNGCATLSSGVLSVTLTFTDGGDGDPSATRQVDADLQGPSESPAHVHHASAPAHHAAVRHHRRHRATRRHPVRRHR